MEIIISIISILISALSVTIAILSFASNKAELIIFKSKDGEDALPVISGELKAVYTDFKKKEHTINSIEGLLFHIQVFNPSPKDIAYFHMGFTLNDRPAEMWTKKSFAWATDDPKILYYDLLHGPSEINIPEERQGVFKAHSFTPLYLYMPIDLSPIPPKASFQFRYAVRRFPYVGKAHRYSEFIEEFSLKSFSEILQSKNKVMQQLKESKPQQAKPSQTPPYSKKHRRHRK